MNFSFHPRIEREREKERERERERDEQTEILMDWDREEMFQIGRYKQMKNENQVMMKIFK